MAQYIAFALPGSDIPTSGSSGPGQIWCGDAATELAAAVAAAKDLTLGDGGKLWIVPVAGLARYIASVSAVAVSVFPG
jgi:hypothetical protein